MRLFCNILQNRGSLCHGCRHHHIDRSPNAYNVKIHMGSTKLFRLRNDLPVFDLNLRTQCAEPFQMLIDRTAADIAPTRKSNLRSSVFSKQCAQKIIRRSDFLYIIILYTKIMYVTSIDLYRMTVQSLNPCPDSTHCFQKNIDIIDIRNIINRNRLICHNRCCQNRKSCIFCTCYLNFSDQRISTFYNILLHIAPRSLLYSAHLHLYFCFMEWPISPPFRIVC